MASAKEKRVRVQELERKCPSCGSTSVVRDYQQNIEICGNCGRVVREGLKDRGPDWRAFDQEQREERKRSGPPSTESLHDRGLSTQIDYKNRDAKGNKLPAKRRQQVYRLRRWHKRLKVTGTTDRNLTHAFSELNRMSSQLGLPKSVQEMASKLYRRMVEEGMIRGRSIEGMTSGVLYAACRKAQIPRTLGEIAEASRVDEKEIGRDYRSIIRRLNIYLPPTDPAKYVARFGSDLMVSGETQAKAIELIRKAQEMKITSGRSPKGVSAAALYLASLVNGERRTQRDVADASGVTEVTVRNRYKEMAEELGLDVHTNTGPY